MPNNLLPYDGALWYQKEFVPDPEGLMKQLIEQVQWQRDQVKMYGKLIITRREMAWYGDPAARYKYSGITREPLPWLDVLLEWSKKAGTACGVQFNSCLVNRYHDGSEGMGWHRDNEPELVRGVPIASISLGATRRFDVRHRKSRKVLSVELQPGSLLVMTGSIQEHWEHRLAVSQRIKEERINLTYRTVLIY